MAEPLLRVDRTAQGLRRPRRRRRRLVRRRRRAAALAIVGESGSGKTTIARMLVGLERPTAGTIHVRRPRPHAAGAGRTRSARRGRTRCRLVFQDPYTSLDPRQTVDACIDEVLRLLPRRRPASRAAHAGGRAGGDGRPRRPPAAGPPARALRRPAPAGRDRARARRPSRSSLILDEAVAALDVSIQAQVLNLLADIRDADRRLVHPDQPRPGGRAPADARRSIVMQPRRGRRARSDGDDARRPAGRVHAPPARQRARTGLAAPAAGRGRHRLETPLQVRRRPAGGSRRRARRCAARPRCRARSCTHIA